MKKLDAISFSDSHLIVSALNFLVLSVYIWPSVCIVEAVKDVVCSRLLPAWLLRLDGNIIELLHRLDVENCSQTALDTLKAIFTGTPTEELLQNRLQLDNRYTHILQTLQLSGCHVTMINKIYKFRDYVFYSFLFFLFTESWFQWTLSPVKLYFTGELCVSSSRLKETKVMKCWSKSYQMLPLTPTTSMGERRDRDSLDYIYIFLLPPAWCAL